MRLLKCMTFAVFILVIGCKSEDPTPELRDPIYNDLVKNYRENEDALKKSTESIEKLQKVYEEQPKRTIDKKTALKELNNEQDKAQKLTQITEYYRIAVLKRKAESQLAYKKAFAENKPWPDPKEYESYLLNKKMREKPRNWSQRLQELKNPLDKQPAAKEASAE